MSLKEIGKKAAGYAAIDKYVKDGQKIGIGSGSTITFAVERLAQKVKEEKLNVSCTPTSYQAKLLIIDYKLPLKSLEENIELDVAFDGADEVDQNLCLIKGGGGCHLQEKIVASCAKELIIIADDSKDSLKLGENWKNGVPIEVIPLANTIVKQKIESKFGGKAVLRQAINKMGPLVTDNGNFIIDWKFDINQIYNWLQVDTDLHLIPGIVETGLFIKMAKEAFFGKPDGSVYSRKLNN